jgi:hypothetical protein
MHQQRCEQDTADASGPCTCNMGLMRQVSVLSLFSLSWVMEICLSLHIACTLQLTLLNVLMFGL